MQAEVQSLLARLFTDAKARKAYLSNRENYIAGLPEAMRPFFAALVPEEIESFARALIRKRFSEMRYWLPRTQQHFTQPELSQLFEEYTNDYPIPNGVHKIAADALAFTQYLIRQKHQTYQCKYALRLDAAYLKLRLQPSIIGYAIVHRRLLLKIKKKIYTFSY